MAVSSRKAIIIYAKIDSNVGGLGGGGVPFSSYMIII